MAQVSYNPKTGAKLKRGEKVVVNGRTYTEGSSNINGTVNTPKGSGSSGSEKIKTLQKQLNAKGANLVVDGIMGVKTRAAQTEYASTSKKDTINTSSSKGNFTTWGSGTNTKTTPKVGALKSITNFFSNYGKNVAGGADIYGGMVNKFLGGAKDAINTAGSKSQTGAVLNFDVGSTYVDPTTGDTKNIGQLFAPTYSTPDNSGAAVNQRVAAINQDLGLTPTTTPTSFSGDASGSLALQAGQYTNTVPTPSDPTGGGLKEGAAPLGGTSSTTETTTNPDGTTIVTTTPETLVTGNEGTNISVNPATVNGLNQLNMGLKDSASNINNNPFVSKDTKGEFQNNQIVNYADNAAKYFNSPKQAIAFYNTPQGQASVADYISKGGKIADIIAKIKPTTTVNGIQPAQTTAEYLSGGLASQKEERKIMNDMIASEANFTQQQKDILFGKKDINGNDILLGVAEQQKKENEERIAYYDRLEARFDKSEKEKTRLAIDKARAEFEMKDAETEIARVTAKNNLTEFLAKIGALRTDGNALLGIEKLEQSYQAQRQQLRQNFLFAEREIRQASEERMFNLETDLEDKKFKLSQDLSKTEKEVMMEGMKLDHDFNNTLLNMKLKWSDSIKTEREKAARKAEAAADDWTRQYFTASGYSAFMNASPEYRRVWEENTGSWLTPEYKGQITAQQVLKSRADYSATNSGKNYTAANIPDDIMTSLQEDLAAGAPINDLVQLYPEVSSSYLNTLKNSYSN